VAALSAMSLATIGALLAGDLLEGLFVADARAEWGSVDVEVTAGDNAVIEGAVARRLIEEAGPAAGPAAPRLLVPATAGHGSSRVADVLLMGLTPYESRFPPLTAVEGSADPAFLALDEVLLNERLATRLGVGVGEQVTLRPAVPRWTEDVAGRRDPVVHEAVSPRMRLRVAGVVADRGVADLHRTPNAIVSELALQRAGALGDRYTVVHLATPGARAGSAAEAAAAAEALLDVLRPDLRAADLDGDAVAADQLRLAEDDAGLFRSILLTLAAIVIAAAAVAAFGLLVRLGEERSRELGLLRAGGVPRRTAQRLVVAESAAYGVVGAVVGGAAGVPFGDALAAGLAGHFARLNLGRGREQVALPTDVDPGVIAAGALVVVVVAALAGRSSAAALLASDIPALLRGAAPPPAPPRRRRPRAWRAVGWALLGAGLLGGGPLVFLGATAVLGGWWAEARRAPWWRTRHDRRAAGGALVWALAGAAALGDLGAGVQAGFGVLITAGLVAVFAVTVLAATRLQQIVRTLRTYLPLGAPQASLRVAGAWADGHRRQSVTTTATVAGVLFVVAALGVLGTAQALPVDRQAGGFDVLATSVAAIDVAALRGSPDVADAVAVAAGTMPQTAYAAEAEPGRPLVVPYPVRLAGATTELADRQGFGLAAGVPGVTTSAEALTAAAEDRDKAVVDRAALPEGARVGDDIVIDLGASPRRYRLVGVLDTYLLNTAFVHEQEMAELVDFRGPTLAFVVGAEDVDASDVAAAAESVGGDAGLVARTVGRIREGVIAVNRTFTDVFAVILVLGLLVALASIASTLARAARERRAELAVLRALGVRRRGTRLALAAEPLLTGGIGVAVGLAVGLAVLRVLFAVGFSDLGFVVDWARIGLLAGALLLSLAAVCAATAAAAADDDVTAGLRDVG
jgi:putative ABC transport system permease protein